MRTIDTHAHIVPEEVMDLLPEPFGGFNMVGNITDIGVRLADMDAHGVQVQALSAWLGLLSKGTEAAQRFNDALARVVEANPDRFVGLAIAPMGEPEKRRRRLSAPSGSWAWSASASPPTSTG